MSLGSSSAQAQIQKNKIVNVYSVSKSLFKCGEGSMKLLNKSQFNRTMLDFPFEILLLENGGFKDSNRMAWTLSGQETDLPAFVTSHVVLLQNLLTALCSFLDQISTGRVPQELVGSIPLPPPFTCFLPAFFPPPNLPLPTPHFLLSCLSFPCQFLPSKILACLCSGHYQGRASCVGLVVGLCLSLVGLFWQVLLHQET